MKIYNLPQKIQTLIFDIDSTLYTNSAYAFEQVDCQIRYFAQLKNIKDDDARALISSYRRQWFEKHGEKISLGNALVHFGISIEESIDWRRKLIKPEEFLSKDEKLVETLSRLNERFSLIAVTNNPVLPAAKTLKVLGADSVIKDIIGLDTCNVSKPDIRPLNLALKMTGSKAENTVSIGDRFDIDLSLPLEMGMGGILVSGVEEVYNLPSLLENFNEQLVS